METDILVIGSGIAGLSLALKASKIGQVVVATKKAAFDSNTAEAQGGIAIPVGKADEKKHIEDTLKAGRGICNEKAVALMVKKAHDRINELSEWGVKFEKEKGGFKRTLEAGHSVPRIVFNVDATGRAIEHKLVMLARENKNIRILEDSMLIDLAIGTSGSCVGASFLRENSFIQTISAKLTILATGGLGQIYEKTTNPHVAAGDGFAAAFRAGAKMENMEFVQFHPTKLDVPSNHPFLISEVLRGEGGTLINWKGEQFMQRYAKEGELAPRDVVARAIYIESQNGSVYLDMTHKSEEFLRNRFPTIYAKCLGFDLDLAHDKIPVTAAAHYMCGGVKTDLKGNSSIPNLYVIGEVACTGVHGANRLASNSLLEGMVFAHEAYLDAKGKIGKLALEKAPEMVFSIGDSKDTANPRQEIKKLMWEKVGLVRNEKGLKDAIDMLGKMDFKAKPSISKSINSKSLEDWNMAQTSLLVARAALKRKKSLGCHFRTN
ncbi:MAG: L-aspartate oxidase [Candidatus Micrarchaeota archaeon]